MPDRVRTVLQSAEFWVPVLIAIGVASQEYERRKNRSNQEPADDET